jgi:3-methylcrotonyl-CoA carboxylase alpha subunit
LPLAQEGISCSGHAIEARLTAERADEGFQPDTGPIRLWQEPEGLRVDSGVATGSEVSPHYDSLLAKVIAHAPDRSGAIQKLANGLERMSVLGPATTRAFLAEALRTPGFVAGATTLFLAETYPGGWTPRPHGEAQLYAVAAAIWLTARQAKSDGGPWRSLRGFRVLAPAGRPATARLVISAGEKTARLGVENHDGFLRVTALGGAHDVALRPEGTEAGWIVTLDEARERASAVCDSQGLFLRHGEFEGRIEVALAVEAAAAKRDTAGDGGTSVRASMPGTVAALHVKEGDVIQAGQVVAVLESMKLFTELKAPTSGKVQRVGTQAGKTVSAGDLLVAIEPG